MENNCREIREQILEFVSGTLPAQDVADLQTHIDKCSSCSRYLETIRADDKVLGEFAGSMQPTIARLEDNVIEVLTGGLSTKTVRSTLWRTIVKSPVTKLAAAAVIIMAIGIFVFHKGPVEQIDRPVASKAAKSPAELMTVASLNMAYRRGGMEAVEKQCEQALRMLRPQSEKISIRQLLAENNGT